MGLINRFFCVSSEGLENIPKRGPFILASNHISIPDEWSMGNIVYPITSEPVYYIARDDYWWGPWWTKSTKNFFCVLLIDWKNPSRVLEDAKKILEAGGIVGIYPEGTRNTDQGALALGKTGIARLVLVSKASVVPVGYYGPPIATVWDIIKSFMFKRSKIKFVFGRPIDFFEYYDKTITRELLYEMTDKIMIEIGKLCDKRPRSHGVV